MDQALSADSSAREIGLIYDGPTYGYYTNKSNPIWDAIQKHSPETIKTINEARERTAKSDKEQRVSVYVNVDNPSDYKTVTQTGEELKVAVNFSEERSRFGEKYRLVMSFHTHPNKLGVSFMPSPMDFFHALGNPDVLMAVDTPGGALRPEFYGAQSGTSEVSPFKLHELYNFIVDNSSILERFRYQKAKPGQTYEELLRMPKKW